jgi:hypothetical protein
MARLVTDAGGAGVDDVRLAGYDADELAGKTKCSL